MKSFLFCCVSAVTQRLLFQYPFFSNFIYNIDKINTFLSLLCILHNKLLLLMLEKVAEEDASFPVQQYDDPQINDVQLSQGMYKKYFTINYLNVINLC